MNKTTVRMLLIIALIGVFNTIRNLPFFYKQELVPSVYDGVFIIGMYGVSLLLVPLIMVFFNLNAMKYDFRAYNIVRRKNKMEVWAKQAVYMYLQCVLATIILMVCAGAVVYYSSGCVRNLYGDSSMFAKEFEAAGLTAPRGLNFPAMFILAVILNSAELYARVMAAVLVYWLTDTPVASVISAAVFGLLLPKRGGALGRISWFPRYVEMFDTSRLLMSVAAVIVAIVIIWLIARCFIPRKQFLKE